VPYANITYFTGAFTIDDRGPTHIKVCVCVCVCLVWCGVGGVCVCTRKSNLSVKLLNVMCRVLEMTLFSTALQTTAPVSITLDQGPSETSPIPKESACYYPAKTLSICARKKYCFYLPQKKKINNNNNNNFKSVGLFIRWFSKKIRLTKPHTTNSLELTQLPF